MATTVDLTPETERRLDALIAKSGQSKPAYLRQLIEAALEDAEDYQSAVETLGRIRRGEEEVLSSEDFWRGLDG
jgi:RHH-type rel operon transcriptional repressor/antitoxin RelB